MPFKKGQKKIGGKKKGTKNQKTLEWEEFGRHLLEYGLPRAQEILSKSTPDKFMEYFPKLLEYFKPKLGRTELKGELNVNLPKIYIPDNGRK